MNGTINSTARSDFFRRFPGEAPFVHVLVISGRVAEWPVNWGSAEGADSGLRGTGSQVPSDKS
jgi:hypothetical protein